jgi:rhodanese-related sulfurtransferase
MMLELTACQTESIKSERVSINGGSYQNIEADTLNTILEDKDFVLVNVHIPFVGNIAGTDLSIPYNEIQQNLSQLPAKKDTKIVLYCSSGRMSQMAAEELASLGYTNIWNLKGGMVEWKQAGFELEQ